MRSPALAALAALACVLAAYAAPARAATARGRIFQSAPFSQPAAFHYPTGVAVDQDTGNVYVLDSEADAVDVYGPEGGAPTRGVPSQITGLDFGAAPEPEGIAVDNACHYQKLSGSACEAADPANGDLYVTEAPGKAIVRLHLDAESGEYQQQPFLAQTATPFEPNGVAVDANGNVYVANYYEEAISEFDPSGEKLGEIGQKLIEHPAYVAVGPPGVIYVGNFEGGAGVAKVEVNTEDELEHEELLEPEGGAPAGGALTVDSAANAFLDGGSLVTAYDPSGGPTEEFGSGALEGSKGVAVNDETHDVYVTDPGAGDLAVFGLPAAAGTQWATDAASGITVTAATLNGTVNPEGAAVTSCEFEYGTTSAFGQSAPCAQSSTEIGEGTSPVSVSAEVSGLAPATKYFFRLAGTGAKGTDHGAQETFTTLPPVDGVETGAASNVKVTEATVEGSIEPDGAEVEYYFEYGTASASGSTTTPAVITGLPGEKKTVTATLTGLSAGAVSHYKLIAKNKLYSQLVSGAERSLETLPAISEIETGQASEVSATTATVTGSLAPNTEKPEYDETEYYFEYSTGSLDGSGSKTPPVTISRAEVEADPGSRTVNASIAGLAEAPEATVYHYRLVARNALGMTGASEQSFATQPVFSSLTTGRATSVGPEGVTLHGTFKSAQSKGTIYWLEYRTCAESSCGSWTKTAEATLTEAQIEAAEEASHGAGVSVEATVTGLQPGTSYSYRLAARNTTITMTAGASMFTTGPRAPRVESEQASEVTARSAVLTATVDPGNSATSGYTASYHFEYERVGASEPQSYAPNGETVANGAVATIPEAITGLTPESEYSYRLILENATGKVEGATQTFTTATAPPPTPETGGDEGGSLSTPPVLTQPLSQPLLPLLTPTPPTETNPGPKPLTRAQRLAKAIRACKRKPRRLRAACVKQARRRYGPPGKRARKHPKARAPRGKP